MAVFLKDIEQGKIPLKHVDVIADKSSPVRCMPARAQPSHVNWIIEATFPRPLLVIVTPRCPASQIIEAGTKIGSNPMEDVKKGIAAGAKLKHVDMVDRSAPIIEADVKVHENVRPALFAELKCKSFVETEA
jgi:hypothetical protein